MGMQSLLEKSPFLAPSSWVHPQAILIGDVTLGDEVSIWPLAVLRGDIHKISVGPKSNIQDGAILHVTGPTEDNPAGYPVIVEEGISVGHRAVLHGCHIQNHCLVGMGCTVLDGAIINEHVILAAGSLVAPRKKLTSGFLWMGSPAEKVRILTDKEIESIHQLSADYVQLIKTYIVSDI